MRQPTTSIMGLLVFVSCLASTGCKNKSRIEHDTKILERKIDELYSEIKSVTEARELASRDATEQEKESSAFITIWREHQKSIGKPANSSIGVDEAIAQAHAELDALAAEEQRIQSLIKQVESDSQAYSAKYSKPH